MIDVIVASWIGLGLLAFSAWCVRTWAVSDPPRPEAGWTARLVYLLGAGLVWAGALLICGAIMGLAARVAWHWIGQ